MLQQSRGRVEQQRLKNRLKIVAWCREMGIDPHKAEGIEERQFAQRHGVWSAPQPPKRQVVAFATPERYCGCCKAAVTEDPCENCNRKTKLSEP